MIAAHLTVNDVELPASMMAAVASKYWLFDRMSIVRLTYWHLTGRPLLNGERWSLSDEYFAPTPAPFKVVEYSSGFELEHESGKRHWISDGVDAMSVELPTKATGETEDVTLVPGLPFFAEAWAESLNSDADETYEAYFGGQ